MMMHSFNYGQSYQAKYQRIVFYQNLREKIGKNITIFPRHFLHFPPIYTVFAILKFTVLPK